MTHQQDEPIVPAEYAGKWIAWTSDGTRIAGAGDTPEEAEAAAKKVNVKEVIHEWVPPADEQLIGGVW